MRNTPLSATVIKVLKSQHKPISVPDILSLLKTRGLTPNKTSLYRLLDRMKEGDFVEEVLLDSNLSFYELKGAQHHHHFVCDKCKKFHCVADKSLEKVVHQLEQKLEHQGLQVQSHQFSFSGLCKNCTS
ncbi:transcriptional repressor [Candidatus Gracilibacteria bacterium]|nr:transcriptional repressor [Candidatus Gracilibacteria bacterium]